eukprot:TRINITY_DN2397_c0_g1_i2.p1 TRINITY_DN2397_c0_g1~~TRINITY_DN2397_c0_g1_i2.p1  ORF type:complete len:515 (+),score=15.77 TRINITY_DN2397_c0_g1_i2:109-1653(+)
MLLTKLILGYEDLWKHFIRPPRFLYEVESLGPNPLIIDGLLYRRVDMRCRNKKGFILHGSLFISQEDLDNKGTTPPLIIFLHGNAGSRLDALTLLNYVTVEGRYALLCFDFAGCGHSEGDYISLGYFEQDDVESFIEYLNGQYPGKFRHIILWGHSMGSATALFYASTHSNVKALVLDSPFSDLRSLAHELSQRAVSLPNFVISGVLSMVASSVEERIGIDIMKLSPKDAAFKIFIPGFFAVGEHDEMTPVKHTKSIYNCYAGPKKFHLMKASHTSERPSSFYIEAFNFIKGVTPRLTTSTKMVTLDLLTEESDTPLELSNHRRISSQPSPRTSTRPSNTSREHVRMVSTPLNLVPAMRLRLSPRYVQIDFSGQLRDADIVSEPLPEFVARPDAPALDTLETKRPKFHRAIGVRKQVSLNLGDVKQDQSPLYSAKSAGKKQRFDPRKFASIHETQYFFRQEYFQRESKQRYPTPAEGRKGDGMHTKSYSRGDVSTSKWSKPTDLPTILPFTLNL